MTSLITPRQRLLITISVMAATVMQVLDTTIVNVALPNMQGTFSATPDQISWVLTSYLVASAIFMPLTGFFSDRLGRKHYLTLSIFGFTLTSALCGLALNLDEIVFFRLLQGIFGAALVPLSQAILIDIYPPEERGKAMAIWGVGVMVGPILGPTLGGYLTDILSWRWTFYINVPVGLLSLLMTWQLVPQTAKKERSLNWLSLIAMAFAIGATQYVLDRGNQEDWLEATSIKITSFLAISGFIAYFFLSFYQKKMKPIFDVDLFKDWNFVTASIMMMAMGLGLYGSMVIQSLMLENLFDYPTFTTGLTMAPRGIASMLAMLLVGKLSNKIRPQQFITVGLCFNAIATYLGTWYNLEMSIGWVVIPSIIQGIGIGFVMIPLSTVALATLPPHLVAEGAGFFSLMRTFGFSLGISIVTTLLARHTQIAWNHLGGFLNPFNSALHAYLQALNLKASSPKAALILAQELSTQAQMLAIVDIYIFIAWSFLFMFPLILLLRSPSKKNERPAEVILD